jgi:hypothetical protein
MKAGRKTITFSLLDHPRREERIFIYELNIAGFRVLKVYSL